MNAKLGYLVAAIVMDTDITISKSGAVSVKPTKGSETYAYVSAETYAKVKALLMAEGLDAKDGDHESQS